ncbi:hypothetical protein FRX31_035031 [Thalictrum thalictroides]|uniref:SWIM-type domain-containing protein n=1 Tax=Thalictrum thalictroides TaxID=46969 RepID=A0A7J6UT11_THATH|nr:hypothetical protein FRX31_035031 [Thalictrum thalictroides]
MRTRRGQLERDEDVLCPRIRKKLEEQKEKTGKWTVTFNGETEYEIEYGPNQYVVNIATRECTCRMWALSGILCCHAIAAIYYKEEDPDEYVSHYLKVEYAKKAYQYPLPCCNGEKVWERTNYEAILPPVKRKMPGRPKKARRLEFHERAGGRGEVSRVGKEMHCTNCGKEGHNRKTCKEPITTTPPERAENAKEQAIRAAEKAKEKAVEKAKKAKNKAPIAPRGFGVLSFENGDQYVKHLFYSRSKAAAPTTPLGDDNDVVLLGEEPPAPTTSQHVRRSPRKTIDKNAAQVVKVQAK